MNQTTFKRRAGRAAFVIGLLLTVMLAAACQVRVIFEIQTPVPSAPTLTPTDSPPGESTPANTATSTSTEAPEPTATPTTTPTQPPAGIQLAPGSNHQAIVNAQPAGSTFVLAAGVHERFHVMPRTGDVFVGEDGAILDGMGNTYFAFQALDRPNDPDRPVNVTIRNLEVRNYISHTSAESSVSPEGAIDGAEGWVIEDNYIHHNKAGISLGKGNWGWGDGAVVRDNVIADNGEIGVEINGSNILFEGNELARNGYQLSNAAADWMGAASKFSDQGVWADNTYKSFIHRWQTRTADEHLIIRNNHSHHNNGMGLWLDVFNQNAIVENNLVEFNRSSGIFDELSTGSIIRNNVVRWNRLGNTMTGVWGGAEIMIANSANGLVARNSITVSEDGRGVIMIDESYRTPRTANYRVVDNEIAYLAKPHYGTNIYSPVAGISGGAGNPPFQEANNLFDGNTYVLPEGATPTMLFFYWDGGLSWVDFKLKGHEANGRVITAAGHED